jgi:hypothetical protein
MNKLQKKKSKIIKKYYKELVEFCKYFNTDIPTYCSSKVYFNRILRLHKINEKLKRKRSNI